MSIKRILSWGALIAAALLVTPVASAQRRVLVYGPGGTSSIDDLRNNVASVMTGALRGEFTVASEAMWRSMTTAQFAAYNAIWIDGGACSGTEAQMQAATDTRLIWSPAITGHFEVIGSDSDLHIGPSRKFLTNSYHYVTSGAGTGLFVSTSCIYASAPADTPVPWLQGIGDFRVTGDGCTDGQLLEPTGATHPVHLGINPPTSTIILPGDLAWGCFTHSHFNRHPPSFERVYSIGSLGEGHGVVIVNDRGGCVIDADCIVGQFCNRDPSGGDPTCRTTLGNGRACTLSSECTSGICTEGVCCNGLCGGQCESCRNAGSLGLCTATIDAPVTPRAACTNFGTTCGGRCNGVNRAACTFPTPAVPCSAAFCSGGIASAAASCDGVGACATPHTSTCNPYVCGPNACLSACVTDLDCVTGTYCSAGACITRIPPGMGCTSAAQCASGNCVDGLCCNTACNGQCEACDVVGALGTCSAVTGAPRASRRACTGSGTCGGVCDGTLRTACTYPNTTTQCGAASCTDGRATTAALCDGSGACGAPSVSDCGRYTCDATTCRTTCDSDAECVAGNFCSAGACVPRLPPGQACTVTTECASGNCVDGMCCNTACNGQCEACDVAGALGTCSPVTGTPHNTRTGCAGSGSCAGTCDGVSRTACSFPGSSTECRAASCAEGHATNRGTCDSTGSCTMANVTDCAPFTCDGAACRSTCTTNGDCIANNHCDSGRCVPDGQLGVPCTANDQCGAGGVCSGGVCCNRACDGQCESCTLPGRAGTCTPLMAGTQNVDPDAGTLCRCDGVLGTCATTPDAGTPVDVPVTPVDVPVVQVDAGFPMDVQPTYDVLYRGSGCGCSTPGQSSGTSVAGLAFAALALVVVRRRKR